jgi:hypothetical protein
MSHMKPKLVIHQLAWIPHYFPLYYAAMQLSKEIEVEVRFETARNGSELFLNASTDNEVHIVLAGLWETFFEDCSFISNFVCASVLIDRSPLWIYSKETLSSSEDFISTPCIVPPKDSTLFQEFTRHFDDKIKAKQVNKNWVLSPEVFTASNHCDLLKLLATHNAKSVVSIYPLANDLNLHRLNVRPFAMHYGFTALWVRQHTVEDEQLLEILSSLQRKIIEVLKRLSDFDADILSADENHDVYVKQIAAKLTSSEILSSDWWEWLKSRNGNENIPWIVNAADLLAGLAAARIWHHNFLFSRRDGDSSSAFHVQSLTQFLLNSQTKLFRSRISVHIDEALTSLDPLKKLAESLGNLNSILKGGSDDEEIELFRSAESLVSWLYSNIFVFRDRGAILSWHEAAPWQGNESAFILLCQQQAATAPETVPSALRLKQHLERIAWLNNEPRERFIHFLQVLSQAGETATISFHTIVELKALSKRRIPLSWLGISVQSDPWKYYMDLSVCAKRGAAQPNPILVAGHAAMLLTMEGAHVKGVYYDSVAQVISLIFQFKDVGARSKNLAKLIEVIYVPKQTFEGGVTSKFLRKLLAWGFELRVIKHTASDLEIELSEKAGEIELSEKAGSTL